MHEHSLIANLLGKIEELAAAEAPNKIQKVTVQLGALAHISADHFREHFDHAVSGTSLASVSLMVECDNDIHAATAQDILLKSIDFIEA